MIYRVVSDISHQAITGDTSFCVKVINGIVLTYSGVFRDCPHTCIAEVHASTIGIQLIEDYLKSGDSVVIHSDTTQRTHLKDHRFKALGNSVKELNRRGIHVHFNGIKKTPKFRDVEMYYTQCHNTSRHKLRVRIGTAEDDKLRRSAIWQRGAEKENVKFISTTDTTY
jgi:hypothetical protein